MSSSRLENSRARRPRDYVISSALLACLAGMTLFAAVPAFNEYQLKAVFLFRFAQFVEWPASPADEPFSLCIFGDDPFDSYLVETVRGEMIAGQPFTIQSLRSVSESHNCRILYIHRSEKPQLPTLLEALEGRAVLTVSDASDFAQQGGMIEFVTTENRIRLKINVEAARSAELVISSKLLRPATIVATEQG